jgi:cytochrome b
MTSLQTKPLRVWDVPTRLFHWALVVLVVTSVASVKAGNMDLHLNSGYAVLSLVLFRILWGFFGTTYARFGSFVRGPGQVVEYAKSMLRPPHAFHAGHNPMGGWMVVVMLAVLLFQASTGLFANDDVITEGPLAKRVSKAVSDTLSTLHRRNEWVIYGMVALHVLAVVGYLVRFRENLVRPMLTGTKQAPADASFAGITGSRIGVAAALLAVCATGVWFVAKRL